MKRIRSFLLTGAFLLTGSLCFSRCGGSGRDPNPPATDTSPMVSAPDNNSANNPSLADTGYEKNRTRPITDTAKARQDTPRRRR